jgi:hypothetical protein
MILVFLQHTIKNQILNQLYVSHIVSLILVLLNIYYLFLFSLVGGPADYKSTDVSYIITIGIRPKSNSVIRVDKEVRFVYIIIL